MRTPSAIGRYPVRQLLGTGGFAVVWLAYDERLDDQVAIKVLAEHWADRVDVRERFDGEARALRRARSHRVVEVFDIDVLPDGRPYFVMTYADRGSLADRLADGRLPMEQALRYGAELAKGVGDLHAAGVLHRDIKPSNVLFRSAAERTRLLIADLGLSRDMARGSRLTLAAGTPGYMAPEQDDPERVIDQRVDVFGVGATVYHALTGRVPDRLPVPPSTLRPDLPQGADAVLLRALAADPDDRWSTAAELASALDGLTAREPAHPPHPPRRRRVPVPARLATVVVAVLILAGVAVLQWAPWQSNSLGARTLTTPTSIRIDPNNPEGILPPESTDPTLSSRKGPTGLPNCRTSDGHLPVSAAYALNASEDLVATVQLCRDSAQKYWAFVVLHQPGLGEGEWANAYLYRYSDGEFAGAYSCAVSNGASGYITSPKPACWTGKMDGTDARFTFLAGAKVCRGSYNPNPTDCRAAGQAALTR